MPANFIEEFEDENGARFVVFKIRYKKEGNLLKRMMIDGIEIVCEAALVAYAWKSNLHPAWPLMVSAMGAVSVIDFYRNARRYILKLPRLQRDRLRLSCYLATGAMIYFTTIHAFSEALKCNNKVWIPCLAGAASGYILAVSSVNRLERTVSDMSPFMKCCQLLFGPTLIGCAAYYLLSFRQHDEEWLPYLPMITSAHAGNYIALGLHRDESNNEPRWLLFKGLEMFLGGCLLMTSGFLQVIYAANNQFHPLFIPVCTIMVYYGYTDIENSLEILQACVEMEEPVFYCISGMIRGPIVFLSACLSFRCIDHPIMIPIFCVTAGFGLYILGYSVMDLHDAVPRPVFKRYCQRVLGPVVTVYSSLVAAYVGCSMGWRFSLVAMPFIPAGIYATYKGYRRRNRP